MTKGRARGPTFLCTRTYSEGLVASLGMAYEQRYTRTVGRGKFVRKSLFRFITTDKLFRKLKGLFDDY